MHLPPAECSKTDSFANDAVFAGTRLSKTSSLFIDQEDRYWIGANTGLHLFYMNGTEIAHYASTEYAEYESICLNPKRFYFINRYS